MFGCSCFVLHSEGCTQDSTLTELKHSDWSSRKLSACASSTGRKQRGQLGVMPCSEASKPAPGTHFLRSCDPNLPTLYNQLETNNPNTSMYGGCLHSSQHKPARVTWDLLFKDRQTDRQTERQTDRQTEMIDR